MSSETFILFACAWKVLLNLNHFSVSFQSEIFIFFYLLMLCGSHAAL